MLLSLSVDELVVDDGGGKFVLRAVFLLVFHADDTALAKHLAVLLAGDFLGHLEDHLDQCIFGEALRASEQHSRLAEVLDDPLAPCAEILYPVPYRCVESNSAGTRHPCGLAHVLPAFWRSDVSGFGLHALSTAHGRPVVLVLGSAKQADLVELSVRGTSWPRKLV